MNLSSLGVTPQKAKQFEQKNIMTAEDLIRYFPRKYNDFSKETGILPEKEISCLVYHVDSFVRGTNSRIPWFKAHGYVTETAECLDITWFHQNYLLDKYSFCKGRDVLVAGKIKYNEKYGNYEMSSPVLFEPNISAGKKIYPVYSKIPGMSNEYLTGKIQKAIDYAALSGEKLLEKHEGLHKKYGAASVLNQIIIFLARELDSMYTDHVQIVSPKVTKATRIACNLDKDHTLDAYSIAFSTLKNAKESIAYTAHIKPYEITQQRRHNRTNIDHQNERLYKVGKDVVATNRHKRMSQDDDAAKKKDKGQTTDSLEEWRNKQYALFFAESIESGENMFSADIIATKKARQMISKLRVLKSKRAYSPKERLFSPGDVVLYNDERHVVSGHQNNGKYLLFVDSGRSYFKPCDCKLIERNRGLVYL